jgi:hypothetical protein
MVSVDARTGWVGEQTVVAGDTVPGTTEATQHPQMRFTLADHLVTRTQMRTISSAHQAPVR